ncbi:hypothetical protein Plo01_44680 [Planobispora longispora]|uniref:Uncharacterized protein n=1 Tax=Planobispora longispora TaxID=28887 RepID=A0A8J3RQY4_9ACTN|nr:hypothetical protein Plo01_44680 [Planobispora longispora]
MVGLKQAPDPVLRRRAGIPLGLPSSTRSWVHLRGFRYRVNTAEPALTSRDALNLLVGWDLPRSSPVWTETLG